MKDAILNLLKKSTEDFISGQIISEKLGVSRTAIWKYINILRKEGYTIDSYSKKGYKLISSPDILTYEEVKNIIHTKYIGQEFFYFDSIDSTNTVGKKLAEKGEPNGTIIVSEEQTMGHGRLGRNWVSPKYKGIWLSIILRPNVDPINVSKITQIAAAAMIRTLKSLKIDAFVKWPNDIVMNDKKICGILTEMSAELNRVNYVIVGMGINANLDKTDFNKDILNKATSLKIETNSSINRKIFLGTLINEFEKLYDEFQENFTVTKSIEICKKYSAVIGNDIKILHSGKEFYAKAIDIEENGELVVQYKDGSIEKLISGEISIRGLNGYI
ncbi:biotin--[acetyl-CoA-carboxylase] ligase [Clostridium tyrobutyricum]|jgi:BirA family biotin operon repressor/biotin-[acetyl-CoA-carboxylase] ligase|uniref:Bifunctional ligase/repressor BirA n=1 Tax=Clostridium tyrobutyricum DIVETGP TaxID=1408889 RepID=W6N503_CLOTY|nr:biotin--[acetyl-CoA-carboxylase] ligase [Clostridium tyrobutyricum]AND84505.1 biotin operon repressor/ biotin-(Acetyl-CoA carboxylase) ligase [Clostridium tyrobutyricum]ANP69117.1 biotin--[acetyl-CoA-carboxylase] ligase [Clostridium tyrobutyricum]MBR9647611.1 biotin--[acetyl-CoA-carboxylase] ligase [Clostridium tyrobutyricum]MBV4415493.1 biotin--[acetyl-CoA-carboxylase] ligase [Clostridium tyrobutyricum]MBV4421419.1 biotin--[acetyl-CoA-carboxylase] ligase [Clostridium tyrobutyricum]